MKSVIGIAIITVLSKILGFLRETFIASSFGANAGTDSYVIAVTIVSSFYLIMGDVINNTFIPQYLNIRKDSRHKADRFASSIINIMLLATIILLIICGLFTKQLVFLFAPGLSPEASLNAVEFTRLLLPTLVITGLSIAVRSILQANSSFIGPVIMGIPNHIIVIGYLLLGSMYGIKGLVYATALGTSIQLFAQLPFIKGTGFRYIGCNCYEHKDIVKFAHSMGFILIGSSVNQINTLIDRALASFTGQGNISILNYAHMLYLFVAAVFITSITTVIFPRMAESTDVEQLQFNVRGYLRVVIAVLIPVCLLLIYFSNETVYILFGRGNFTPQNVIDTAGVLNAYLLGIIPFGISEVLNRTFYSFGDAKTPMRLGIFAVFVNIILNLILVQYFGIFGLALATSIAAAVYMAASLKVINKKISIAGKSSLKWLFKVCIISLVSIAAIYFTDMAATGIMGTGLLHLMLRVAAVSIITLSIYALLMYKYGGCDGK